MQIPSSLGTGTSLAFILKRIAKRLVNATKPLCWPANLSLQLRQLMVVGIDCCHDLTSGRRSTGALVASLNQGMSRYVCLWEGRAWGISYQNAPLYCEFFCTHLMVLRMCWRWFLRCVLQHKGPPKEILGGLKSVLSGWSFCHLPLINARRCFVFSHIS